MSFYVPDYLPASMQNRFAELAEDLQRVGYSDVDAPLLVKYLMAENEYTRITNHVTTALIEATATALQSGLAPRTSWWHRL